MTSHLVTAVGLLVGLVLFGRPRTVRIGGRRDLDGPTVTVRVVIPARNEAASIGNLLHDLAGQVGDGWEVVVVDDGSEDTTAEIARRFDFVTVVTAPPRPPAWVGKPWACTVGVHHLSGEPAEELVFLDADVRLAPGALAAVVGERRAHGGVLSVQPFHRAGSAVEELSALFNVVSFMGIGAASAHPHGLFGPVIACRRDDYHAVGGHGSVRSAVIEDVELALAFEAAGIPVAVRAGGRAVSFRMYPLGLRSIVDGWSKNMALGARSVPAWRTLGVAWWVTSLVSASAVPATWWANPTCAPPPTWCARASGSCTTAPTCTWR